MIRKYIYRKNHHDPLKEDFVLDKYKLEVRNNTLLFRITINRFDKNEKKKFTFKTQKYSWCI